MTKKEINKLIGLRLCELMELKNIKSVDLINFVNNHFNDPERLHSSTMSNYRSGSRPIPRELIELFSKCMETNPGYLLYTDNFFCKTYDEYLQYSGFEEKYNSSNVLINQFEAFGFILASLGDKYSDADYFFCPSNDLKNIKGFSKEEAEQFRKSIEEYALKLFNEKGGDSVESGVIGYISLYPDSKQKKHKTSKPKRK